MDTKKRKREKRRNEKKRKENNLDIYSPVKYNAGQLIEYLETTIKRFSTLHHYIFAASMMCRLEHLWSAALPLLLMCVSAGLASCLRSSLG